MRKKIIKIATVDQAAGRVMVSAKDVVNGTRVALFLNGDANPWGEGVVMNGAVCITGRSRLQETYSLTLSTQTVNTKLLPETV